MGSVGLTGFPLGQVVVRSTSLTAVHTRSRCVDHRRSHLQHSADEHAHRAGAPCPPDGLMAVAGRSTVVPSRSGVGLRNSDGGRSPRVRSPTGLATADGPARRTAVDRQGDVRRSPTIRMPFRLATFRGPQRRLRAAQRSPGGGRRMVGCRTGRSADVRSPAQSADGPPTRAVDSRHLSHPDRSCPPSAIGRVGSTRAVGPRRRRCYHRGRSGGISPSNRPWPWSTP